MFARTEEFLAEHLGGRYQDEVAPDVAERLAAITVDPATVEMPEAATGADAARTAPLPAVAPEKVALDDAQYRSTLSVGGQEMQIESERTIRKEERDGEEVLVGESNATTPMGAMSDSFVLGARSLRPRSRSIQQGPTTGTATPR